MPDAMVYYLELQMSFSSVQGRVIRVRMLRHERTGLLAAVSDDLAGLVLHGYSHGEIKRKLPAAIRELLEAEGYTVVSVETEEDDRFARAGFGLPGFIANAALTNNHRDL